jgi:hypothetical protein
MRWKYAMYTMLPTKEASTMMQIPNRTASRLNFWPETAHSINVRPIGKRIKKSGKMVECLTKKS